MLQYGWGSYKNESKKLYEGVIRNENRVQK